MVAIKFIQLSISVFLFIGTVFGIQDDRCVALERILKKQRFLDIDQKEAYCDAKCNFSRIVCDTNIVDFDITIISDAYKNLSGYVRDYIIGVKKPEGIKNVVLNQSSRQALTVTKKFALPYITNFIPLVSQRLWGRIGFTTPFVCAFYFLIMFITGYGGFAGTVFAFIYSMLGVFVNMDLQHFQDMITNFGGLFIMSFVVFTTKNFVAQTAVGIIVIMILIKSFMNSFNGKSESSKSLIFISITQLIVVCRYLYYMMSESAVDSFAIGMLKVFVEGAMPYGSYNSFFANMFDSAVYIANSSHLDGEYPVLIFLLSTIVFALSHFLIRCLYGITVYKQLGFGFNIRMLWVGYYSYMIDIWHPLLVMFNYDFSKTGVKRKLYACLMLTSLYFECSFAVEVIFLRVFLFMLDHLVFQSGFNYGDKKLDVEVNFDGLSFPKAGSFPFCCLDTLTAIAKNVVYLDCSLVVDEETLKQTRGVGLIRSDERGMTQLLTAAHVLRGINTVKFNGNVENVSETNVIGDSCDPVVSMPIIADVKGADVHFLTSSEVRHVSNLFTVGVNRLAFVKDFEFGKDGDINMVVDLKQGDSGSAILAVLKNGAVRYAGAVSRGTFNDGTGNISSSVVSFKPKTRGSPGTQEMYHDITTSMTKPALQLHAEIRKELVKGQKGLEAILLDEFKQHYEQEKDPDKWDGMPKVRYKKRIKSYQKERAAQKQGFLDLVNAINLDPSVSASLAKAYDDCKVIDFNIGTSLYSSQRPYQHGIGFVPSSAG